MENFKSPYFSASIKEFWSRWHISLSTWFRDYVYIPLGGNRVSKARHYMNLLITFIISGLWHGSNWTFIIWGAVHGFAQIIENALTRRKDYRGFEWAVRVLFTFTFCMFAWIFFRVQNFTEAVYVFMNMFDGINNGLITYLHNGFSDITLGKKLFLYFVFSLLLLSLKDYMSSKNNTDFFVKRGNVYMRWFAYVSFIMLYLTSLHTSTTQEFIYFQF